MALLTASRPLGNELQRVFPSRPFNVRFWDGNAVPATAGEAPTFFVRRPTALAHFLAAPGTLGLGRAYVDGSLAVRGLAHCYVADASVMPSITHGHTHAPTVAIAERAAELLAAR